MTVATISKRKAAFFYAKHLGWKVLPLHTPINGGCSCNKAECEDIGKHPRNRNGVTGATDDLTIINKWWGTWPDANIGIATGAASGFIAVDIDPRHGGDVSLDELINEYGPLPNTVEAITGSGGRHILFKYPGFHIKNLNRGEIAQGIDIKGDGGYIVVAPSLHESGNHYEWELSSRPEDVQIADMPEWLATLIQKANTKKSREARAQITGRVWKQYLQGGPIEEGTRDNTLFKIGSSMRSRGAGYEDILATLTAVNDQRCTPPLPWGTVEQKATSATKYRPGKTGLIHFPPTDYGNAERLAERHGADIKYCDPLGGWLIWDGKVWTVDKTGEVVRRAVETVRAYHKEAASAFEQATDDEEKKRFLSMMKFAKQSESRARIDAMLALAKAQPGISISDEDVDQDIYLLNVENGTLDLRTGKLLPHRRENLITKIAPVEYRPNAKAPRWERFIHEIMNGDADMCGYLQRKIGYILSGDTSEEDFDIFYGPGGRGKSKLLLAIRDLMGSYAQQAPASLLMDKQYHGSGPTPEIARIKGARFVATVETSDGRRIDEELVKLLTGRDPIAARHLHKEMIEFIPQAKFILATNYQPTVKADDTGFWRRTKLIPFVADIKKKDKRLSEKLRAEMPGILNWALEGFKMWQKEGLNPPAKILAATEEYRGEMDILGAFLEECCEQKPGATVPVSTLYRAYERWCDNTGEKPMKQRMLTKRLKDRGYQQDRDTTGTKRVWVGFTLRREWYPSPPPVFASRQRHS